jgi:hypothetical protein
MMKMIVTFRNFAIAPENSEFASDFTVNWGKLLQWFSTFRSSMTSAEGAEC